MDKNRSDKQSGQGKKGQGQSQINSQRKGEPNASTRSMEQDRHRPGSTVKQETGQQAQHSMSGNSTQSPSSQSSNGGQSITNQDQQRQVTNADNTGRPMGEEETEGDRQREERLKPYKNAGDDSGETEKKSPTMK